MNTFTSIFLITMVAGALMEYWLVWRQARHISANRDRVPEAFASKISLQDHRKAAAYSLAKISLQKYALALGILLLLLWTLGGGLNLLAATWAGTNLPQLWQGVGLILSVVVISSLLELPTALWSTFRIETSFGFNRTSAKQFTVDLLLQLVLLLLIGTPLLLLILWLMESAGEHWWLWAWLVWIGFTLTLTWAYPILIAPIFNKFKPLEDDALRLHLERLLDRCGFQSNGMFVMDGSKRSAHGNAYFTGFGKNKRIVFFDTLLSGMETDEIEAVLAHELGHFKHKHVLKMMGLMGLTSLLGLALLGWLIKQDWFYSGLGVSQQSSALALVLFMLVIPVFTTFLTPLFSAFSRKHEFEADDYAASQADANSLINGLVKMYRDNASTLTPDRIYSAFHHSHPPAPIRIAHLSSKIQTN